MQDAHSDHLSSNPGVAHSYDEEIPPALTVLVAITIALGG